MLSFDDYAACDALDLADLVRKGEVTASELMDCALSAIDTHDPRLNAVVIRDDAQARKSARESGSGAPFSGVPFLAKDVNVDVAGWPMTYACRYFADAAPAAADSVLAARWKAAGLVMAGRTNTPEFATDFVCEPELYGPTRNPWNTARTPGGSSGGAAAAVAAGLVPMAHATDSGGSIRVPASCCGVFGFKPTSQLVATGAAIGPLVNGLNCDHVVTRSVRDSAALLDLTIGPEPGAPAAMAAPAGRFLDALQTPPAKLRVGLCLHAPCGRAANPEIAGLVEEAATLMTQMGHEVQEWSWPDGCDPYEPAAAFWTAEVAYAIAQRRAELGRPPAEEETGGVIRWAMDHAARCDAAEMVRMRAATWDIRRRVARAMQDVDILLMPVVAEPPLEIGLLAELAASNPEEWRERSTAFAPFTEIFNLTGQPAMSVPLFQTGDGLPAGIQFVGRVGDDLALMGLAGELERRRPWPRMAPVQTP